MYRILVPSLSMCDNLLIEPDALSAPNRELVEWWEDYQSRRYQATPARFIRRHLAPPEPVPVQLRSFALSYERGLTFD